MTLLRLFLEFFKVGLFAFGGGNAAIPFLYELAKNTGWFSALDLTNGIAVSEATPGPVGVNMASYVGYTVSGIPGLIIATFGLVCPSVIIILIISYVLKRYRDNPLVESAFTGLRPASMALISSAFISIVRVTLINEEAYAATKSLGDLFNPALIILAAVIFILMRKVKLHPLIFIFASAAVGIIFRLGE